MKFNAIVVVALVFIFVTDVYLYQQNKHLTTEIAKANKSCIHEYATVDRQYRKQVNKLSTDLENQPDVGDLTKQKWRAVLAR
jgi:hypothetical protein